MRQNEKSGQSLFSCSTLTVKVRGLLFQEKKYQIQSLPSSLVSGYGHSYSSYTYLQLMPRDAESRFGAEAAAVTAGKFARRGSCTAGGRSVGLGCKLGTPGSAASHGGGKTRQLQKSRHSSATGAAPGLFASRAGRAVPVPAASAAARAHAG